MPQPNIVVIISDDQTLADQVVMTKTNNLLGGSGTTFQRCYTSHGVCVPSRATFFTGQYPHNHGVLYNQPPSGGYTALDHTKTLSVWLQNSGYYTAYIGKYLNGLGDDTPWTERPAGWSNWQALIDTYMMYDWTMNDNGTLFQAGSSAVANNYQTDAIATRAQSLILSRSGNTTPFFLVVAPATPHKESNLSGAKEKMIRPAPRHAGVYATLPLDKPPSYNESDTGDKPVMISKLPKITASREVEITKRFRVRREALLSMDDLVETVVNALTTISQIDNTVIIYWSDNGYEFGEHRIQDNKNEVYEESLRIPLLIRGGGFPHVTSTQYVSNVDLAPTIVTLAEATATRVMDGRDLKPLALNSNLGLNRNLLLTAYHGDNYARAIRTSNGYYWVEHNRGQRELYDLNVDPYELENKEKVVAYNTIKGQLQSALTVLKTCSGNTCSMGTV